MRDTRYEIRSDLIDTLTTDVPIIKAAVTSGNSEALLNSGILRYNKAYWVNPLTGADTNSGLTPLLPFKTLAAAIVANNVAVAADITSRNVIYLQANSTVTITTLPNKCDVVGTGSAGGKAFPVITIANVIGAGTYVGTRFINVGFASPVGGGVIMTIPGTTSYISFLACEFDGDSTTPATKGILATAVVGLTIKGCRFVGKFSTTPINLAAGAGDGALIEDNYIESGDDGILIDTGYTCTDRISIIRNNLFNVADIVVNEVDGTSVAIVDNKGSSEDTGQLANTFVYNPDLCSNNLISCGTGTTSIYPAQGVIPGA